MPGVSKPHRGTRMKSGATRRRFIKGSAAALGSAYVSTRSTRARAAGEITIFTWETYHDDPWIAEYTEKTGVTVNVVRTGSVDEMFAQASSGAVQADIIYFDTSSVPRYLAADLIAPLDASRLTNAGNITGELDWVSMLTIDGKLWGVPYNWGTQPLMFNTAEVSPEPDSWGALWDPKYEGKVNMFDDAFITFPMVALYVGAKNAYQLTDEEFEACRQALAKLRPQVRTIARGFDDAQTIYAAGDAVIGYCQNISIVTNLQGKGLPFHYSFPKEGTPTWIDCAILSKQGADRQEVYDFIDANLEANWQARFIQASTNNGILSTEGAKGAGIPEDVLVKTNLVDQSQPGFWEKMSVLQPPEDIDRRVEIWNEFKAGTL